MNSKIVLIRHGITKGNERRLYYGSTDVPLAERGIEELRNLAEAGIYPDSESAQYYTSGMLRTEQTMKLIYGEKEHEIIEDLQELNFGAFEMKHYDELESLPEFQEWINSNDESIAPPDGESIAHFSERVRRGFEELKVKHELLMLKMRNREEDAMSICVCHGGVISGIMGSIWPDKHEYFFGWVPDPGHGYVISMEDGKITGEEKF